MSDLERVVRDLTKQRMTPQFVAEMERQIQDGYNRTEQVAMAMDGVRAGLTDEENRLADEYEEMIASQEEGTLSDPAAREAFEKRARLVEEAIQRG